MPKYVDYRLLAEKKCKFLKEALQSLVLTYDIDVVVEVDDGVVSSGLGQSGLKCLPHALLQAVTVDRLNCKQYENYDESNVHES